MGVQFEAPKERVRPHRTTLSTPAGIVLVIYIDRYKSVTDQNRLESFAIFGLMKIWYSTSQEKHSLYYYPFTWNKLMAMFNSDNICLVEHFSGVGHDEKTYYKSWYGCSPEFLSMKGPMILHEFKALVKKHVKWPHEFKLIIGRVKIERGITGGIVFTADEQTINHLIEKLNIPKSFMHSTYRNKLLSIGRTGKVKVEGEFVKAEDLLNHGYDELMRKVSPGYFEFMDALESAPLEEI